MKIFALVFLGGGLGSMIRFALSKWVSTFYQHHFPLGTLMANVAACLIIGLVVGLADHRQLMSSSSRVFWAVGFCGGFSTFSAFTNETISLAQNGHMPAGLLYIMLSLALCTGATLAGFYLSKVL